MLDVLRILGSHRNLNTLWHTKLQPSQEELPWKLIEENHMWNFNLWHEEDLVRVLHVAPMAIVAAKRNIDIYNQSRNNAIEKIDEWILMYLNGLNLEPGDKKHSETPGMIIDRLSIMSLKRYHMEEETHRVSASEEHWFNCKQKVLILDEQMFDLSNCLLDLLHLLETGSLDFKVYRQFKMYNDPNLNPKLYMSNSKLLQNEEAKIMY